MGPPNTQSKLNELQMSDRNTEITNVFTDSIHCSSPDTKTSFSSFKVSSLIEEVVELSGMKERIVEISFRYSEKSFL